MDQTMRVIRVVDYDEMWPQIFLELKQQIESVIDNKYLISIEHVGSTSVDGLAAKPIIDIDIVIDMKYFEEVKNSLETLQYYHNGDQGIPGREAFKLPDEQKKKRPLHHLYVCDRNANELTRHLAFRDYLRNHNEIRDEYGKIKKEGAQLSPHDINGYMDHKGEFVTRTLEKALKWSNMINPPIDACGNCGAKDRDWEYRLEYIGLGDKKERYEITCKTCGSYWEDENIDLESYFA